ncbi:MAG: DUF4159 domain-containing protein [Chthoniobacterales bacterium]
MKEAFLSVIKRFSRSRDFTISIAAHLILILIFGTAVVVIRPPDKPDMEADIAVIDQAPTGPPPVAPGTPLNNNNNPPPPNIQTLPSPSQNLPLPLQQFDLESPIHLEPVVHSSRPEVSSTHVAPTQESSSRISAAALNDLRATVGQWTGDKPSNTPQKATKHLYSFPVFVGQYAGGNWDSTVRVNKDKDRVIGGSIPNLLYYLDQVSASKVYGNEDNIHLIRLDSPDLLVQRPPFVFLTGTRDFKLTDKEIENLRNYLQVGGAIWGDSSVPGRRSRFDIAFRREMRRVIPDKNKNFEELPKDHPLFTKGYFHDIHAVVPGLNHYDEPVYAIKMYGQVSVLYTANDYADMWQLGLREDLKTHKQVLDLRLDENENYVAVNPVMLKYRESYVHNVSPAALEASYRFGSNIIVHFLTRWDTLLHQDQRL